MTNRIKGMSRKESIDYELKRKLKEFHDADPDVILMNATAAINPSIVLKEAWKKAYPGEKPPYFLTVNPREFGSHIIRRKFDEWYYNRPDMVDNFASAEVKKGKKHIEKVARKIARVLTGKEELTDEVKGKRILVFDECSSIASSQPEDYIANHYNKSKSPFYSSPTAVAFSLVDYLDFGNVWIDGGSPGEFLYKTLPGYAEFGSHNKENQVLTRGRDDVDYYRQLHGKKGKKVIKELKDIGERIGEEVEEETASKKRLESRVAVASIISLFTSILFASQITGNIIGVKINNLFRIFLFLFGLFLGTYLFYLRKKR